MVWSYGKYNKYFTYIVPDKALFAAQKYRYISYFSMKTYVVGTH